jgi:hypothetical protein
VISTNAYQRRFAIDSAAGPLGWIFWGVLICILDLNIAQSSGDYGVRFDFVNDVIGTVLIAAGVFRLAQFEAGPTYATAMVLVKASALMAIAEAALSHFVVPLNHPLALVMWVLKDCVIAATVLFCFAMNWLSQSHGLGESLASWRTTCWLMVCLYLVPMSLLQLVVLVVMLGGGGRIQFQSLPLTVLVILVMLIPGVHLLLSLRRMSSEAESRRFFPHSGR